MRIERVCAVLGAVLTLGLGACADDPFFSAIQGPPFGNTSAGAPQPQTAVNPFQVAAADERVAPRGVPTGSYTLDGRRVTHADSAPTATRQVQSGQTIFAGTRSLQPAPVERPVEAAALTSPSVAGGIAAGADLPPNARPGQCFARVLVPAQYDTTSETVLAQEESERIEVIPARYEMVEERVKVQDATERMEVVPATYRTVSETIVVEPERTELKTIPAEYETVTERIKVRDAYTTWKPGTGPITKVDNATGEILCLVEVPAEYKTVSKRVLKTPARTVEQAVPAVTRTVTKRVVDRPETTRAVAVPPKYETVRVRRLVQAEEERRIPVPARYETVTKRIKIADERFEWAEILCRTNTTPDIVERLQRALMRAGYNPGPIDGVFGSRTRAAVDRYQRNNGLRSGDLTMETVRRLGVI